MSFENTVTRALKGTSTTTIESLKITLVLIFFPEECL